MSLFSYRADSSRYGGKIEYNRCGKSGVLLPQISLGMWHNFGEGNPFETSAEIVKYAFDHGITCFDLANNYGPPPGSAEETFGKILQKYMKPYRDEMFITTKAGHDMWDGPYGTWGSRKHLFSSLDQSLKRMQLDYVDLFYSHRYDPETPLEETLQALVDMVRSGKALYVGISKYPRQKAQFAYEFLREQHVSCLVYQGRYNLLDRAPETEGILEEAKKEGIGFVAFSPLAQGLLTNRYFNGIPEHSRMAQNEFLKKETLTEELLGKLRQLDSIASQRGQTLAEMSLSWLLKDDKVSSVIIGASSVGQLKDNLKAVENISFSEKELLEIDRILKD